MISLKLLFATLLGSTSIVAQRTTSSASTKSADDVHVRITLFKADSTVLIIPDSTRNDDHSLCVPPPPTRLATGEIADVSFEIDRLNWLTEFDAIMSDRTEKKVRSCTLPSG